MEYRLKFKNTKNRIYLGDVNASGAYSIACKNAAKIYKTMNGAENARQRVYGYAWEAKKNDMIAVEAV